MLRLLFDFLLIITMLFSYGNGRQQTKMQANCCSSMMRGASPDGAHPGLHSKPLDATIRRVPAPYRTGIRMKHTKHLQNTTFR